MAAGKISACLCFNRPDLTRRILDQMGEKICIIDNGSDPELNWGGHDMHIRFGQNHYFTGGWNRAIRLFGELGYEWVWMLNSDVSGVSPSMADHLHQLAQSLPPDTLALSPTFNSPHSHMWRQNSSGVRPVAWLDMPAPFMHIERFLSLGGFDEDFVGYGCDLDLCKRAQGRYRFYVADHLGFEHGGGETAVSEKINRHVDVELMNQLLKAKWNVENWAHLFS